MKQRELWFNSDGLNLYGELYVPEIIDSRKQVLCVCHGVPAEPYNPAERGYALLAERLCADGHITFIFNFRGAGRSEGNLDLMGWSHDLRAALDCLSNVNEVSGQEYGSSVSAGAQQPVFMLLRTIPAHRPLSPVPALPGSIF